MRQMCLVCGRMAKQQQGGPASAAAAAAFYSIECALVASESTREAAEEETIGQRLGDILRVELPKKKLVPSEEICKKCFKQLNEIDFLEKQVLVPTTTTCKSGL